MPSSTIKDFFDTISRGDIDTFKRLIETEGFDLRIVNSAKQTAAHIAAKSGNLNFVKYILEKHPSLVNQKDVWNQTVFQLAVQNGMLEMVKYLIDTYHINIFETYNNFFPGNSCVHVAANLGKLSILKYFIEDKKINVNLRNIVGHTPVFSAAANNQLHIVKYLVEEANADLALTDDRNDNILFLLARKSDLTVTKYLLDEKGIEFDINWRDNAGETVVNRAAVFNNINFIRYIVSEKHANIHISDNGGNTPLHEAAEIGGLVVVKYLIDNGADPLLKNSECKTPLELTTDLKVHNYLQNFKPKRSRRSTDTSTTNPQWVDVFEAAENNDEIAVKDFIEKRGTVLHDANGKGETVAHIAARNGNLSILRYMLEKGPFLINKVDMQTNTPLHVAAAKGQFEVVKIMVDEYKADILFTNYINLGNTAVHMAAQEGHLNILKYFIEQKKVDVNVKNDMRQSPVFSAAFSKRLNIIRYLVEEMNADITMTDKNNDNILYVTAKTGDLNLLKYLLDERKLQFDINWRDKFNETVVFRAARFGQLEVIKYLVEEKQADVNIVDKNNRTPLHETTCMCHDKVVAYLIGRGVDTEVKDKFGRTYKNIETLDFLKKNMSSLRERRSVNESSFSLKTSLPTVSSKFIFGKSVVHSLQFDPFLILMGVCTRYYPTFSDQQTKHESLLSPSEIVRNRMDFSVLSAIDVLPYMKKYK